MEFIERPQEAQTRQGPENAAWMQWTRQSPIPQGLCGLHSRQTGADVGELLDASGRTAASEPDMAGPPLSPEWRRLPSLATYSRPGVLCTTSADWGSYPSQAAKEYGKVSDNLHFSKKRQTFCLLSMVVVVVVVLQTEEGSDTGQLRTRADSPAAARGFPQPDCPSPSTAVLSDVSTFQ